MKNEKFLQNGTDGLEGIHPSKMTAEQYTEMGHKPLGFRKAIKAFCLWCVNGSYSEVTKCVATECPLYPYRTGKNPFKPQREYTDEERQAFRERFAQMRNKKDIDENDEDEDEEQDIEE
ncbi:hypothetical protein [Caudoviricetes sp.]|nr:hypothetical protein [Caudoviricetes sp.]